VGLRCFCVFRKKSLLSWRPTFVGQWACRYIWNFWTELNKNHESCLLFVCKLKENNKTKTRPLFISVFDFFFSKWTFLKITRFFKSAELLRRSSSIIYDEFWTHDERFGYYFCFLTNFDQFLTSFDQFFDQFWIKWQVSRSEVEGIGLGPYTSLIGLHYTDL